MKQKKGGRYPSKPTLNLAIRERSQFSPVKLIPLLLLIIVLVGLFGKFAVADRLATVDRAEAELAVLQQRKAALTEALAGYDELAEQYNRYSVSWMTDEEKALLPCSDVLDLIEKELMPNSLVLRFSASDNVLSAELGGITLEDTSRIVQRLYQLPEVTNVSVYTASTKTETGDQATVSIVITMALPAKGGGQS